MSAANAVPRAPGRRPLANRGGFAHRQETKAPKPGARKGSAPAPAGQAASRRTSTAVSAACPRKGITDTKSAAIVPSVPTCGMAKPEPLSEHRRTGTGRQARAPTGCGASQSEALPTADASEPSHAEVAPTALARAVAGEKERNNHHEKGRRLFRASRPAER